MLTNAIPMCIIKLEVIKMTFLEKLDALMIEKGINKSVLSKESGIPYTTIDGFYKKGYDNAKLPTIKRIASYFGVTIDYLILDDAPKYIEKIDLTTAETAQLKKYRTLDGYGKRAVDEILRIEYDRCSTAAETEPAPTLRIKHSIYKASAGFGFDLEDRDEWDEIDIPDTPEAHNADFAVTIFGNSMEPIYHDNDIVLVKIQDRVNIGETGIFVVNGQGYIKQYGGDRLISVNSDYNDIIFSEGDFIKCAGKVIGTVKAS